MSKKQVLHLANWYPNKEESLLGIFVRKHIQSVQSHYNHTVISIYQTQNINSNIQRVESKFENINEVIYYYKKGPLNKLQVFFRLCQEVSESEFNLIHAHVMGWTSTVAAILSNKKSIPFIVTEHWTGYRKGLYHKLNFISKLTRRLTAKNASQLLVVSKFLKQDMIDCHIDANYTIIPNVVDGYVTQSQTKNKVFSFVFVGDLDQEHKNVSGIIKGFHKLNQLMGNTQLDIIGRGKNYDEYLALTQALGLSAQINFHGSKENTEVFNILQNSHVLLLNSYFETFSIICAEALLCGIPVIATKCGGPESFLNDSTGILIDIGNNHQLTEAMVTIIKNYKSYSSVELKKIAEQFSIKTIGDQINEEYKRIMN
jgi:L-malate glycosyltransferase